MAPMLRIKHVGKFWHIERTSEQVVALGGITLDVEQGEFLVFVGKIYKSAGQSYSSRYCALSRF